MKTENQNVYTEEQLVSVPVKETGAGIGKTGPDQNEYFITEYSPLVEEHAKIKSIVPLKKSNCKFALYIILNICTVCIINLFIAWFPKMNLGLKYSRCSLNEATHLGVYGVDGFLTITEIEKIPLPNIDLGDDNSDSIIKGFNLNIDYKSASRIILLFKYKLFDYIFDETTLSFSSLKYRIKATQDVIQNKFTTGLNNDEISHFKNIFGVCDIDIKIHSIFQIILNELTDPFYLFQLYSIILWYCNEYEAYSTVIVVLTIISLVASVYETRVNLVQIHEMSKYSCDVNIYRKDETGNLTPKTMSSVELVPGDLFEIPEDGLAMPCDAILVNGTVIVNESMLTGESTPILKNHMPSVEGIEFDTENPNCDKFFLFAGTKVVQKRALPNYKVLGIAYSTGFKTIKGNLIRGILYPKELNEKFKKDSTKYILFMSILCVVGFCISLKFLIDNGGLSAKDIVMKFLDLITTTVPPSLPACISVGITYALARLKKQKIICIARERVNVAGTVNLICFDKTGTLTEDHLDISGYVPVKIKQGEFNFCDFSNDSNDYNISVFDHYKNKALNKNYHDKNKDIKQLYVECLACCHGITIVKGKLIGDPIDVKMFEGIGWELKENQVSAENEGENIENNQDNNNYDPLITSYVRPKEEQELKQKLSNLKENENEEDILKSHYEIGIVRRFDFSPKLQRMTTIIKNVNEQYFKVFCKGSPEKIKELCKQNTIPPNFNELLNSYTSKGYRVLAMATKAIKMNFTQSQQVSREFAESNMIFLGLLIVQNKLKKATTKTIEDLDRADIRMVMATGDNILTAISVCKECKLVKDKDIIYSCNIDKNENGKDNLVWAKVENFKDEENDNGVSMTENRGLKDDTHSNYKENKDNILILNKKDSIHKDDIEGKDERDQKGEDADSGDTSAFSDDYPAEEFNETNMSNIKVNLTSNTSSVIAEDGNKKEDNYGIVDQANGNVSRDTVSLGVSDENIDLESNDHYVIALTGTTFEKLYKLNQKYLESKNPKLINHHKTFRQILKNGIVFARMAPEHKALLVESFRKEKCTVLMCGDGANDCSALRSADVGVSLSPEEASIAAHFTSQVPDISCLLNLLREGKGSLSTSIQTFKYMMLYSLIQFLAVTFLMCFLSYLSDFQFLASDLFIIFPLAFFISLTGPYEILTHHYPISSLLTFPIIISIILQTLLCAAFQLGGRYVLATTHEWYENTCESEDDDVIPCEDNSVFFLISHFQYLTAAITFSVAKPFRKPIYTNYWLMGYLILIFFYSIWITINCDDWSLDLFTLYSFPDDDKFRYYLFLVICVNFVVSIFCEWVLMSFVRTCWENKTINSYRRRVNDYRINPDTAKEYSICEYQRLYYADRRLAKEKKNN